MTLHELDVLIRRIEEALQRPAPGTTLTRLAQEFHTHSRSAANRLNQCAAMLAVGDEHQALQLAETAPPLLDQLTLLSFRRSPQWLALCRGENLPTPDAFDINTIRHLNELYAKGLDKDHALYRDYRRAVMLNDDARALAHHKTVAVLVKGSAGFFGVVIAAAQGLHRGEACDAQRSDCSLSPASDERIGVAEFDDAPRLADRVVGGGAGRDDAHVRPAQVVFHGNHAARHVGNHHRDREGRHARGAAVGEAVRLLFHAVKTADAAADHHTKPREVGLLEINAGILQRHLRAGHRELREAVGALGGLGIFKMLRWLEITDLAGDLAIEIRGVERLKPADAAAALDQGFPKCLQVVSNRADDSDSCDDDSSFAHVKKIGGVCTVPTRSPFVWGLACLGNDIFPASGLVIEVSKIPTSAPPFPNKIKLTSQDVVPISPPIRNSTQHICAAPSVEQLMTK